MTRSPIRVSIVTAKIGVVRQMLAGISTLPLASEEDFIVDPRMVAAGESFLRSSLEALFDLSRHILAKGFAVPIPGYEAIVRGLLEKGIIELDLAERMINMAGYRNRMVHFYDEITPEELYDILTNHLRDVELALESILTWMESHQEFFDEV
jgi:uncharacterized protein YutE (UPF0331/DUF86 family)